MTTRFQRFAVPLLLTAILLSAALLYRQIQIVRAEQSGSSPESGATSRFSTLNSSLTTLSYGATASGTWGNWGTTWNRIYSAATTPFNDALANPLNNGGTIDFPVEIGGVDDHNDDTAIPTDSYQADWIVCTIDNNYCDTGSSVAEGKDLNTGLIWSPRISAGMTWFGANNCLYPNGLPGSDGVCNVNDEVACKCVKKTESKTGCEGYDDGNWRLPSQKELLMVYIDGSRGQLTNGPYLYWSKTTSSSNTQNAWHTNLNNAVTNTAGKTSNAYSVRCVR